MHPQVWRCNKTKKNNGRCSALRDACTHRVELNVLYDRINVDPMIQVKYVNTTQQLAEFLAKGSNTEDRWTQLTMLVINMTHTTFIQRNLSVFPAVLNPLFPNTSKRTGESVAQSASAKQSQFFKQLLLRRTVTTRMPTRTITQHRHQIARAGGDSKREDLHQQYRQQTTSTATGASSSGQLEAVGGSSFGRPVATEDTSNTDGQSILDQTLMEKVHQEVRSSCNEFQAAERE